MTEQIDSVDMTPTPEGYASIARMFAEQIVNDARPERQHDTGKLLGGLVDILVYFGASQPTTEIAKLVAAIKQNADRPQRTALVDDDEL